MRGPRQLPGGVQSLHPGQGFRDLVAVRAIDVEVGAALRPKLVGLVEDDQIVGGDARLLQAGEYLRADQRVDADDESVASVADKRVRVPGVPATNYAEGKAEE